MAALLQPFTQRTTVHRHLTPHRNKFSLNEAQAPHTRPFTINSLSKRARGAPTSHPPSLIISLKEATGDPQPQTLQDKFSSKNHSCVLVSVVVGEGGGVEGSAQSSVKKQKEPVAPFSRDSRYKIHLTRLQNKDD